MHDLYSTDPTQDTCSTTSDHADYTAPTRQHEPDRNRSGIDLPALKDVDHHMEFDYMSELRTVIINTSYPKLPFGSGDYPDKLFFDQALN